MTDRRTASIRATTTPAIMAVNEAICVCMGGGEGGRGEKIEGKINVVTVEQKSCKKKVCT